VNIQFEVVDFVKDLSTTDLKKNCYDIILDAAVFHVFSDEDRQRYIKNLEYLIKPGGLYIQLCFSEKEIRKGGPR
jgi:cyclopropane fatty-acyl-phospholipid synthase-like methyltransferase